MTTGRRGPEVGQEASAIKLPPQSCDRAPDLRTSFTSKQLVLYVQYTAVNEAGSMQLLTL